MAKIKYDQGPVTVSIGQSTTVELPPRVARVRLTGLLFESDKTFLLPSAMKGIRGLIDYYDEHPKMSLVVSGHTDRVGDAEYNRALSDERARSIAHYLKDEVEPWVACYQGSAHSQPWGTREDQHMLSAITDDATGDRFYRGPVHGRLDAATGDSVRRFQRSRGLGDDGTPGPETRRALVTAYMQLDGTTLPAGADLTLLGCGESHNEVPTADEVDEPKNRRVEIFLFDPGPPDPAAPARCPGAGCAYLEWLKRLAETIDFDHDRCELLVECLRDDPQDPSPIGDVEISLDGQSQRHGRTGDDGTVWFRNLSPGRYHLHAEKDQYRPADCDVEVRPGGLAAPREEEPHSLDGDRERKSGGGGTPITQVKMQPKKPYRIQLEELFIEDAVAQRTANWKDTSVELDFSDGTSGQFDAAPAGHVVVTYGEDSGSATLDSVTRKVGHNQPLSYTLRDDTNEMDAVPRLHPSDEDTRIGLSTRVRLSLWSVVTPFVQEKSDPPAVDPQLLQLFKAGRFDDLSMIVTIAPPESNWTSIGNSPLMRDGKQVTNIKGEPLWQPESKVNDTKVVLSTGFSVPGAAGAEGRKQFLKQLIAKLHEPPAPAQMLIGYAVSNNYATDAFCSGFVGWLKAMTDDEVKKHAREIADFVVEVDADGVQFDLEIQDLYLELRPKVKLLYGAVSDCLKDRNGIVGYATAPFTYADGFSQSAGSPQVPAMEAIRVQDFKLAMELTNVIARPMCYDTMPFKWDIIERSVKYAVGAGVPPSKVQYGVWAKFGTLNAFGGIARTQQLCREYLRPYRMGMAVYPNHNDVVEMTDYAKVDDALNPGERPPGTPGQPFQVPSKR